MRWDTGMCLEYMRQQEAGAQPANETMGVDTLQMDALQETGNIAAAHASMALTRIAGEDILIDVSESRVFAVEKLPASLGDVTEEVAAVYMETMGSERGIILLILPSDEALWLSRTFLRRQKGTDPGITMEDREAICEIGNISICAYLNAMSKLTGTTFMPSPPGLAIDMLGAILELPATLIGERSDYVVVITTKFIHNGEKCSGYILCMPDSRSKETILDRFGLNNDAKEHT